MVDGLSEAHFRRQPPPQFGSIPAASRPERVESLGMRLEDIREQPIGSLGY
jgi:hypothetical protein